MLEDAGFQKLVYEDFYDTLVDLIRGVASPGKDGRALTGQALLDAFQSAEGEPDACHSDHLFTFFFSLKLNRCLPPPAYIRSAPSRLGDICTILVPP
jgi:hypothetical protein